MTAAHDAAEVLIAAIDNLGRKPPQESAIELIPGHIYRAKRPTRNYLQEYNDRQIIWVGMIEVQYDSPTVANGRHYPRVSREKFLAWAGADVTEGYPKDEWARAK